MSQSATTLQRVTIAISDRLERIQRVRLALPDWAFAAIGATAAIPAVLLHSNLIWGSDSLRLVASVMFVSKHGPAWLAESQDAFLPHLVYGPILNVGGLALARVVPIVGLVGLSSVTGYLTRRIGVAPIASIGATVALLTFMPLLRQTNRLPLYPFMLAFGYLGAWLAFRSQEGKKVRHKWLLPGIAALFLVLAAESHGEGQLFLIVPLLTLAVIRNREALIVTLRLYTVVLCLALPRLIVNFSEGGLSHLRSVRADYFVTNGYLDLINEKFWGHPIAFDIVDYMGRLFTRFLSLFESTALVTGILLIVAYFFAAKRSKALAISALGVFVVGLLIIRPPLFPRYFLPLIPGVAIAAGLALKRLAAISALGKLASFVAMLGLVIGASSAFAGAIGTSRDTEQEVVIAPYNELVSVIDDGRGVIGVRSPVLHHVTSDIETYGTLFLSEREYVTFLTWRSDEAVIRMMEKRDIGWVITTNDARLQVEYNEVWIRPTYGRSVRHVKMVRESPFFCEEFRGGGFFLYRLGPCS